MSKLGEPLRKLQRWEGVGSSWVSLGASWEGLRASWEGTGASWEGPKASWEGPKASWEGLSTSWEGPKASWEGLRASWEAPGRDGGKQKNNGATLVCCGTIGHRPLLGCCPKSMRYHYFSYFFGHEKLALGETS